MSETKPPQPSSSPPAPGGSSSPDDPLAGLFRMSRTAGLGSTEYVAINTLAVVAAILGVASFFVQFGLPLLIIPLAGVILGFIALRQIRDSNGTQQGTWLAVAGLLLALGFGGWAGIRAVLISREEARDRVAIRQMVQDLGAKFQNNELDAVYPALSEKFRERVSLEKFKQVLWYIAGTERLGKLTTVTPNELVFFDRDRVDGVIEGATTAAFRYEVPEEDAVYVILLHKPKGGSQWEIVDLPTMFPERETQGAPTQD